jgi:hypothetical protein
VIPVLQAWALPTIDLWAVFPSGRQASAKARAFEEFIETQLIALEAVSTEGSGHEGQGQGTQALFTSAPKSRSD